MRNTGQIPSGLMCLSAFAAVLLLGGSALANGPCTPDSGFEWCHQIDSWPPAFCKIQVDTDYNTAWVNNYKVAAKNYIMRYRCSGTAYYGSGAFSCSQGGCGGQNLGGGTATKVVASAYNKNAHMERLSCHHQASGWWCYATYEAWNSNVKVVHCYDNSHCGNCQHCVTSGDPSNWKCVADAEVCDGKDNNCNGQTDEGFSVGSACTVGLGECTNTGTRICNGAGNGTQCSVSPHPSAAEKCDGLDNDCDGSADEDFSLGAQCTVGIGECANSGVNVCKGDQSGAACSVWAFPPLTEVCDGKDNDCDGSADENWSELSEPCSVGIGECTNSGVYVCKGDQSGSECSVSPHAPSAEACDGKDNNCNGSTDENWSELGQQCSVGIGECVNSGVYICKGDGSGFECSVSPFDPQGEKCDGKDNDCDGSADEDWPELTLACEVGIGECVNFGIFMCKGDGSGFECSVPPLDPKPESCDGLDNDCDDSADEDWPELTQGCEVGIGECFNDGVFICKPDGTGYQCSVEPLAPQGEKCDGLDNNCDGLEDEFWPELTLPCEVGIGECVNGGEFVCKGDGSGFECSASPLIPQEEKCDGLDNDCDGSDDEDYDLGFPCLKGVGECSGEGSRVCKQDGTWTECVAELPAPDEEFCDGLDNDCDGLVDEDWATVLGGPCVVGSGQCMRFGLWECGADGDGAVCDTAPGLPGKEVCDGLDNDCDGKVDDGELGDPNCQANEESAKQPYAPSGDLDQDGQVDVVDLQCLILAFQLSALAEEGGIDVCVNDAECQAEHGDGYLCRPGFGGLAACYPPCLHELVSFGESDGVACVDADVDDASCLGNVQKRNLDLDCDGEISAIDFNFLVALLKGAVGGPGTADIDNDGQLNSCDRDSDGDGLTNELDCDPLDSEILDCDDGDECTVDSCTDNQECLHDASGDCVSGPFQINTIGVNEHSTTIDSDGFSSGGFVVVYGGLLPGAWYEDVHAQLFDWSGVPVGTEFRVNEPSDKPDDGASVAVLASDDFVVAWRANKTINARLYGPGGSALTAPFVVSLKETDQARHANVAALSGGGFGVFWSRMNATGTGFDSFGQLFGPAAQKVGEEFQVNTYVELDQQRPSAAGLSGGGFVVAWDGWGDGDAAGGVFAQVFTAAGAKLGSEFGVNQHTDDEQGTPQVVALANGSFVVVWFSELQDGTEYSVYARRYYADGSPAGDESRVHEDGVLSQDAPRAAALPGGGFVTVWHSEDYDENPGFTVGARLFDGTASATTSDIVACGNLPENPWFPAVAALNHGGFVVVWHSRYPAAGQPGIYARLFSDEGLAL